MNRLLALSATAALTACSSSHSVRHESSSSDRALPKQAVRYSITPHDILIAAAKRQQEQDAAVITEMPVDYRDCVLPVLVDLIAAQKRNYVYVTVFGHDMDAYLQTALASHGISAYPVSALPKFGAYWGVIPPEHPFHDVDPRFTPHWEFSVGHITAKSPGRYTVGAGYFCGSLCGGRYTFTLKVDGKLCIVTSKRAMSFY
jgi:hypothetical protein